MATIEEPVGATALAAAARAAAGAIRVLARAEGAGGAAAQAAALEARIDAAADVNADTFAKALAARAESASLSAERRDWEIGRAFADAAEPPLALARAALDLVVLAAELSGPDAAAAAAVAAGAARGAVALVAANLTAVDGDGRVAEAVRLAEDAERLARAVGDQAG
jgi:hypothetical protein